MNTNIKKYLTCLKVTSVLASDTLIYGTYFGTQDPRKAAAAAAAVAESPSWSAAAHLLAVCLRSGTLDGHLYKSSRSHPVTANRVIGFAH